jgi:Rrf2 family protein
MRLSSRARYALRMLIEIAEHEGEAGPVSLKEVAQRSRISHSYLEQLAISLKNASLIRGRSGHRGGYRLARSAATITIGQIVQAVIGPINVVDCVRHPDTCLAADLCGCRLIYRLVNERITGVLEEFTLQDLVRRDGGRAMTERLAGADHGCPAR